MSENSSNTTTVMQEVTTLIKTWEDEHSQPNYDPIPTLTRLAEICEVETENYLKMDPDPFDERHPSRTDPECKLGQILKALFRKDNFMNKLVNDYLRDTYYSRLGITGRNIDQLNIAACRLMLDVMPGLETSVVFQPDMDNLIHRLIKWTTNSVEPLQSYATGILAAAMEIPEIASRLREQNGRLVPLLLQRLRRLQNSSDFCKAVCNTTRPFAHLSTMRSPPYWGEGVVKITNRRGRECSKRDSSEMSSDVEDGDGQRIKRIKLDHDSSIEEMGSPVKSFLMSDTSNSSWAELENFMIGTVQIFPPTQATRQILILRYLTPMGEYQEFLSHVFKNDALKTILTYINVRATKEARLAFEALKYLAALLCHKKFAIEFIQMNGLEALLEVPRPSIAATGVSICLYYLGYCEESMERICLLPKYLICGLVRYALWLLECSHDSGRCHAIMFFGLTFQFRAILEEFDFQDGLRKLHNVIATLSILMPDVDRTQLNEDQECAARQIVRHVCVAYRRYLEAHFNLKTEPLRRPQIRSMQQSTNVQPQKATKSTPEEIQQHIETLLQSTVSRSHWAPVDQLLKLGGITLLLKIIAFAYEWNYSGRAETVRSALDVLNIACIVPKVQMLFCEKVELPRDAGTVGMSIILGAAEGDIVADVEVQKAALRVIINCVCAPMHRSPFTGGTSMTNSPNKKYKHKSCDDLLERIWDCVRAGSGIMVLLQLLNVKIPITDADCIRTLACKALAGLARSETVRQIVSKLPLFTSGQLQDLTREPILQEKRQEHVTFQKYAMELLERLWGKHTGSTDMDVSHSNIHRANVVAQTKIQFNDRQLLQLIHQHLISKGFPETAHMLIKEANLCNAITPISLNQPAKFRYSSTLTPSLTPTRLKLNFSPYLPRSLSSPSVTQLENTPGTGSTTALNNQASNAPTPIKLIKKQPNHQQQATPPVEQNSRLQKPIKNTDRITNQSLVELESPPDQQPHVTLDSIITEYLTNQHALCKNPMAICPQFNLFVPHKCPDPKPRITTANNLVVRLSRRAIGYHSKATDRKFVHSRFCPVQTFRSSSTSDGGYFTCAKYLPGNRSIIIGDFHGDVRTYSLHTGNVENVYSAHDSIITHVEPNRTGEFLITCSGWGQPLCALWSLNGFELKLALDDEDYVEYSKLTQDKLLGTKSDSATIYDANTGTSIMRLVPTVSNRYTKNKATFNYDDSLVLSDGVLFDVSSGKQIHKLDKLNQIQSGVFHPNGLEIVSNTEVWDLRTFHLLKTVPDLALCNVVFSPMNSAIYAFAMEQETGEGESKYDSSFKTLDAIDYSSITTFDVKKNIYDLAVNPYATQIAVIENLGTYQSTQESVVRLYDVGRRRDDEDEQEDEDDDDIDGTEDEGSDNDGLVIDGVPLMLALHDNNDNNVNDEDDEDISLGSSDTGSWTSLTDSSSSLASNLMDLLE